MTDFVFIYNSNMNFGIMISFGDYNHHWSYYLAIEEQLEKTSRFVEFSDDNLDVYSIEFARILLAAASETDVILKQFCQLLDSNSKVDKIGGYQSVISSHAPDLIDESIFIGRYNIELKPWENLVSSALPPTWWTANNKVKHQRHTHFKDANLKNALQAVGALHILTVVYYKKVFESEAGCKLMFGQVTSALQPGAGLYRMNSNYYMRLRGMGSNL